MREWQRASRECGKLNNYTWNSPRWPTKLASSPEKVLKGTGKERNCGNRVKTRPKGIMYVPVDHLAWKMIDDVGCTSCWNEKSFANMCALIWWSESEKISKGPKLNETVAYNPFYVPQGAGPIIKPKFWGGWGGLQKEIPSLKERPIYAE